MTKKIRNRYIRFQFTVAIRTKEMGECETLPTPPIKVFFTGQSEAFTITRLNIYQGRKGNEMLTKIVEIKD